MRQRHDQAEAAIRLNKAMMNAAKQGNSDINQHVDWPNQHPCFSNNNSRANTS